MPLIVWNPTLDVHINQIDDEHKQMVDLANTFYNKLYNNAPHNEMLESLNKLISFSSNHFANEENLYHKVDYPNSKNHTREHTEFLTELNRLKEKVEQNDLKLSIELIGFFRNSILNHMFVTDKDMARYISAEN